MFDGICHFLVAANCANIMLLTMPFSLFWCIVVASLCCSCIMIFSHAMSLLIFPVNFLACCSYVYTLSLVTSLHIFSVSFIACCRFVHTLSLVTSLYIFSVGFLALYNYVYAFSLAHCLQTEQDLVLLSLLFSAIMLSHCFCFFSAAGLAGNLVILRFAISSCWAFFYCHFKLLLLLFLSCGTCRKPNNWAKKHGIKYCQQWERIC
jgi:hypothetical protein